MRTHNRQCCSKNCINNPAGSGKVCGCPTGKTPCQDRCVTNCTSPKVLDTSTCQCVCPSGQVECNGACVSNQCGTTQIFNPDTCMCEQVGCAPATVCGTNCTCRARVATCSGIGGECIETGTVNCDVTTCADCTAAGGVLVVAPSECPTNPPHLGCAQTCSNPA